MGRARVESVSFVSTTTRKYNTQCSRPPLSQYEIIIKNSLSQTHDEQTVRTYTLVCIFSRVSTIKLWIIYASPPPPSASVFVALHLIKQNTHVRDKQNKIWELRENVERGRSTRPNDQRIGTPNDRRTIAKTVTRVVRVWYVGEAKNTTRYAWADVAISKRARRALSTAAGRASSSRSGANRKKKIQ